MGSNLVNWLVTVIAWGAVLGASVYCLWARRGLIRSVGALGLIVSLGFVALLGYGASVATARQKVVEQAEFSAAAAMVSDVLTSCAFRKPPLAQQECDMLVYSTGNSRGMDRAKVKAGLESSRTRAAGAAMTRAANWE